MGDLRGLPESRSVGLTSDDVARPASVVGVEQLGRYWLLFVQERTAGSLGFKASGELLHLSLLLVRMPLHVGLILI